MGIISRKSEEYSKNMEIKIVKRGMISVSPEFFFIFLCFAFKAETQYDFMKMIRIELNCNKK